MTMSSESFENDVFFSYAAQDRERVLHIVEQLEAAGVSVWLDRWRLEAGEHWDVQIVRAIRGCKLVMIACSASSIRSRCVKQEIQVAWRYRRPYLPVLIDSTIKSAFPEQFQFFLEGWQWIDIEDLPTEQWLPKILRAVVRVGVACQNVGLASLGVPEPEPRHLDPGLEGLFALAKFTDLIRPIPARRNANRSLRPFTRDLGEPPDDEQHTFHRRDSVCLAIDSQWDGHLLLLNLGTSGSVYCLCPSLFAPDARVHQHHTHYLPQPESPWPSFKITGPSGRERLLAIITNRPLGLDWMPHDRKQPTRLLRSDDIDKMLTELHKLPEDQWIALSTYFEVVGD